MCSEHRRRRLEAQQALHVHFSNHTLRIGLAYSGRSSPIFTNWPGFFLSTGIVLFLFFLFGFFFWGGGGRDCLLCAICEAWLHACCLFASAAFPFFWLPWQFMNSTWVPIKVNQLTTDDVPVYVRQGEWRRPRMTYIYVTDLPSIFFICSSCTPRTQGSCTAILWTPFCMRGLTIQNRVFYEWKQKNLGWAPSRDPTATIFPPWLSATPCSMYEKKNVEKPFPPWVRAVSKIYNSIGEFTIPLEVCILMRGVQWALWFVTSSWSKCWSDQRCAAKLSAWWAAKRRLISNDRHGVISLWILANKPSSFS